MREPYDSRGVLSPGAVPGRWRLNRYEPDPEVARFVEFHWIVRWDLRGRPAHRQKVLSHPNIHLVFERPRNRVYGVVRDLFERVLEDRGQVFGVKFRAGGFRPFTSGPVSALTDRAVAAEGLLGPGAGPVGESILASGDDAEMVRLADRFLLGTLPPHDPVVDEVAAMVAHMTADPTLVRVDDVAAGLGVSVRRLQRLFAEYVGVGPKWVLRRARLQEVAARAEHGEGVDWAGLAADLGYSDQAHLTRDFTAIVGMPPTRYARV